jgi:hypothetical protein
MQSSGATTTTIGFDPINFQTVRLVVLTHVTVLIGAEPTTNAIRRHGIDVGDDTSVCLRHIEIKLHITAIQIERCFSGSSTITLDAPATVLNLHTITVSHYEITSIRAVHIGCHADENVAQKGSLHGDGFAATI